METIKIGSLVAFSSGEYSDYCVGPIVRVLVDLDWKALRDEYIEENPKEAEDFKFKPDHFIEWLTRKGLIEAIPWIEWHTDNYGKASDMKVWDQP